VRDTSYHILLVYQSSQSLTDIVSRLTHSNPPWLFYPIFNLYASLRTLSHDDLRAASLRDSTNAKARDCYGKMNCIDIILDHFELCRGWCLTCSFETLRERLQNLNLTIGLDMFRFNMISTFFKTTYGTNTELPWKAGCSSFGNTGAGLCICLFSVLDFFSLCTMELLFQYAVVLSLNWVRISYYLLEFQVLILSLQE
jgi:hypothetical protein